MENEAIFDALPNSVQNPLMSKGAFFKHCQRRFRWVGGFEQRFVEWLEPRVERGLIRAAYRHDNTAYFSPFQAYQVWRTHEMGERILDSEEPLGGTEFEALVRLMTRVQDFYLTEIRSNQRVGEHVDYRAVAIGGTYFSTRTQYMLSTIRAWRQRKIADGHFDPVQIYSDTELDAKAIERWFDTLLLHAKNIDPLSDWHPLVQYVSYSKRRKLKFDALLAQDFYEMAELLKHFIADADTSVKMSNVIDRWDTMSRDPASGVPSWKVSRYGDALSHPYEMLEFLTNEYDINPKPRAIVFTEGEEWKAVKKLYSFYDFSPELLGIEFRSLSGGGNFSLVNWQCFVEYMHEKQVLVYFLLDNEGRAPKQVKKLLAKKRTFGFPGLSRVIPSRDRIRLWSKSFEESNFTDAEIKRALSHQGIVVDSKIVKKIRSRTNSRGLINELSQELEKSIDKPRLAADLAEELIAQRQKRPDVKRLRPIEKFVKQSGHSIMLNHQPTSQEHRRLNMETGHVG